MTRAQQAEAALQTNLTTEETRAKAAEAALQTSLTAEENRAKAEEETLLKHTNGVHTGKLDSEDIEIKASKHLYFGDKWRINGSSDGKQLLFQFNSSSTADPNWVTAVPFITQLLADPVPSGADETMTDSVQLLVAIVGLTVSAHNLTYATGPGAQTSLSNGDPQGIPSSAMDLAQVQALAEYYGGRLHEQAEDGSLSAVLTANYGLGASQVTTIIDAMQDLVEYFAKYQEYKDSIGATESERQALLTEADQLLGTTRSLETDLTGPVHIGLRALIVNDYNGKLFSESGLVQYLNGVLNSALGG